MKKLPNPIDIHVGRRIRARRMAALISQETLARALGVTFQQVQKYEKGTNRVSASRIQQTAGALGVTPAYFFEGLPEGGGAPAVDTTTLTAFMASRAGMELARLWPQIEDGQRELIVKVAQLAAWPKLERAA